MESRQGDGDKKKIEDETKLENLGLSTSQALEILQKDIKKVIEEYEIDNKKNKYESQLFMLLIHFFLL